ncbi:tRNA/tmRNA/rRNA uracil-C5-methylase (TrmA/RlmC/RlmD family) [Actinoplanes octamycinicus]|uniref:tRNA/tmRNA/rRNA uracil-C5-methylase (TrmA/RlmC/RlmD family) n=1 Tax=Actinoplanes octamycinicus TaxID=135948 RepID=A0A7W7M4L5_9ACTN|nr:TRAM domain-containing protein [Actinoplanes octamycinicus]MBB4736816.1 tRNA/tmRNA/rRNA uracil-C5-methylase (TrmA/RlmC/RlmD family) [Actinoplanes octamycinicus]GIE60582.1 putative RNA methyltransferase [Actinoplanes octamycinicus]
MTLPEDDLVEGDRIELTVGAPAHGGHCVARFGGEHGRVVFVRHALPGERVTAEITERHRGYLRADAVAIHEPSPDRVRPPCEYAHPGGCGGCDLQHVSADAQLRWKTQVVREQLGRLAGLTPEDQDRLSVRVEPLTPGEAGLLGWRTRVRYAIDAAGRPGLLQHRSHQVVPIDRCLIAHPAIQELDLLQHPWPESNAVQAVASGGGDVAVLDRPAGTSGSAGDDPTEDQGGAGLVRLAGPERITEVAGERSWELAPEGFWQVHPAAAATLTEAVLAMLRPAPGEIAWDLYGGAGLFAAAVAARTGARTTVVESSPLGVAAARSALADLPQVEVVAARVETALGRRRITGPVDLVVLDPPRAGAGARVVRGIAGAGPRAVAYVACDPAALARDVKTFRSLGWELAELRAFDCFPMTQHVECVALLTPPGR